MKILKPIILSVFAVVIAVMSSIASYVITANILKRESNENFAVKKSVQDVPVSVSAQSEIEPVSEPNGSESLGFKCYMVKLEGDKINVYVNYKEHEELLYGEQINVSDLSIEDKELLTEGKEFEKMSELTEFTENFTS